MVKFKFQQSSKLKWSAWKICCSSFMYWTPKLHYKHSRAGFIIASWQCSTKSCVQTNAKYFQPNQESIVHATWSLTQNKKFCQFLVCTPGKVSTFNFWKVRTRHPWRKFFNGRAILADVSKNLKSTYFSNIKSCKED